MAVDKLASVKSSQKQPVDEHNAQTNSTELAERPSWWQRDSELLKPSDQPARASLASNGSGLGGDLTVCDIIGEWGLYHWSLVLFAALYSAVTSVVIVWGPMFTPDMAHICRPNAISNYSEEALRRAMEAIPADRHECFLGTAASEPATQTGDGDGLIVDESQQLIAVKCTSFLYNELGHGLMLTNGFDLVCDRRWLRSLVYSSALAGMLISSVTLGVFADKFGRLRCVQVGFVISCIANVVCIVARDYFLFCACIFLMGYAQIGAVNSLIALTMEATSPRFRYVPIFQFGAGWAMGTMILPLLNSLTHDYRLLMGVMLGLQLLMVPWLHWGVFESIRWLLSEGHLNRAQIELRRACRMNKVRTDTGLAQSIARIELQQVRKASHVIEHNLAPRRLSHALGVNPEESARELDMLSFAIRTSILGQTLDPQSAERKFDDSQFETISLKSSDNSQTRPQLPVEQLSPTLSRMSFSVTPAIVVEAVADQEDGDKRNGISMGKSASAVTRQTPLPSSLAPDHRASLTSQGLIQLAMKYSKTIEREDQGQCFLMQMFHRKLWRQTVVLLLVSVMFETAYYGLVQANKIVGSSVDMNYVMGAISDLMASFFACLLLAFASRQSMMIGLTVAGSMICLGMAASYHFLPAQSGVLYQDNLQPFLIATNWSLPTTLGSDVTSETTTSYSISPANFTPELGDLINREANLSAPDTRYQLNNLDSPTPTTVAEALKVLAEQAYHTTGATGEETRSSRDNLVELRKTLTFYLMVCGKFVVSTGIMCAATVGFETYPNNLRQTGSGAILFVGRVGSILAPFLFDDPSQDKHMFKMTLVALTGIGLFVACLIPVTIRDQKDKELCDQLNEIE